MPHIPAAITGAFVALVVSIAVLFVVATARAGRRVGEPPNVTRQFTAIAIAVIVAVMGVSALLASMGVLRNFSSVPPPLIRVLLPTTLLTIGLAFSPFGTRLIRGLPLAALIGFQVFRVPVELLLHALNAVGALPEQMTFDGMNPDVLTGFTAPLIAWIAWRGKLPPIATLVWNVAGLALLLNIVVIAMLSVPGPLQYFHAAPGNRIIAEVPYVWLPTVLVPGALFGHLLVFRSLRQPGDGLRKFGNV